MTTTTETQGPISHPVFTTEQLSEIFQRISTLVCVCHELLVLQETNTSAAACCVLNQIGVLADLSGQSCGNLAVLGNSDAWFDVVDLSRKAAK